MIKSFLIKLNSLPFIQEVKKILIDYIIEWIKSLFYTSSPQFNFNLVSYNSYVTYVIIGENLCLSILLVFFIFTFYYFSLNFNSFPNFEGVNINNSLLKSSRHIYINFFGYIFSFVFNIDLVVLFFLYLNLIIFSNNFDFLSSERIFSNSRKCVVLIFKQWSWFSYINNSYKIRRGFSTKLIRFSLLDFGDLMVLFSIKKLQYGLCQRVFYFRTLITNLEFLHPSYLHTIRREIEENGSLLFIIYTEVNVIADKYLYDFFINRFKICDKKYPFLEPESGVNLLTYGRRYYFSDVLGYNFVVYCLSLDVIHSLFIKTLVLKMDIFYGKISFINLREYIGVLNEGTYLEFICYEYCGLYHHNMYSRFLILDNIDLSFFSNIFS